MNTLWEDRGSVETLDQAITLFEQVGMRARNLSAFSRRAYRDDLRDLQQFLVQHGITKLSTICLAHLEAYQAELDRRGYASSTRNRKTQSIKALFSFLDRQGLTSTNIAARLISPPIKRKEPRYLSEDEYQRLLRACSRHPRDAAILEVFLQTGMRLSELAKIQVYDLELPKRITPHVEDVGTVRIRRKGGTVDTIPLNYKACRALSLYLKARPHVQETTVFISKFRLPISVRSIQNIMEKYCQEVGIHDASVHTLRHTMATHHVSRGTDLKTIQETLGHASLETTTIYIQLAKKAQKKALQDHAL